MDKNVFWMLAKSTLVLDMEPTGSRVIMNPPPEGRDEDWVVLVSDLVAAITYLQGRGFTLDGNPSMYANEEFRSTRKGDLNLIIVEQREVYDRYVLATEVAKKLNLQNRADRVALFQTIRNVGRNGFTATNKQQIPSHIEDYAFGTERYWD